MTDGGPISWRREWRPSIAFRDATLSIAMRSSPAALRALDAGSWRPRRRRGRCLDEVREADQPDPGSCRGHSHENRMGGRPAPPRAREARAGAARRPRRASAVGRHSKEVGQSASRARGAPARTLVDACPLQVLATPVGPLAAEKSQPGLGLLPESPSPIP